VTAQREPPIRRVAVRILAWQVMATAAIAVGCVAAFGPRAALSALAGGAIGTLANLYMTFAALRAAGSPGQALVRLYVGQFMKVMLTVGMFFAVVRQPWLVWPALFGSYIATLAVFWLVPVLSGPRLPPRSRPRPQG
jgi:F0F1-type ATP synthase assembly protein I